MTGNDDVRELVHRVFEQVRDRPGDLGVVQRRARRRSLQTTLLTAVVVAMMAAGVAVAAIEATAPPQAPFIERAGEPDVVADPAATGIETRIVHGVSVFTVPEGDTVTVFVADPQHLENEQPLWWCPEEQVFFSPFHGELFSRDGVAFAGPAARNLDRLQVEPLADGTVRITAQVVPGARADVSGPIDEILGRHLTPTQVDTYRRDPAKFCADPVVAAQTPERAEVTSLEGVRLDGAEYTVLATAATHDASLTGVVFENSDDAEKLWETADVSGNPPVLPPRTVGVFVIAREAGSTCRSTDDVVGVEIVDNRVEVVLDSDGEFLRPCPGPPGAHAWTAFVVAIPDRYDDGSLVGAVARLDE